MALTWQPGRELKLRMRFGPQYPQPIIPTEIFLFGIVIGGGRCFRVEGSGLGWAIFPPAIEEERGNGAENDEEIKGDRHEAAIFEIEVEHLAEGRAIFAIDLPPTGDAWREEKASFVFFLVAVKLFWGTGSRAHEAHFASEDIDELGEFIETRQAEEPASGDESRVT